MRCNIRYSAAKLSPKRAWVRNPSNSALTGDSSDMKLETTGKRAEDKCQKMLFLTLFPLHKSDFPSQFDEEKRLFQSSLGKINKHSVFPTGFG